MQLSTHSGIGGSLSQRKVSAFGLIDDELGRVKKLIDEQLADCSQPVDRLLGCVNTRGGKMLRPGLVLLSGASCGKITDKHIRIAAIIELIHNATLLHDDVIDEGQRRRGLPTINSLQGNESAVLLGDFLLSKVFKMCAGLEAEIIGIIAAATARTCEGELRQIIQRNNWQLSESEYIEIITEKSAAFFGSCCHLGGLLAGANEEEIQLLDCYGVNTGIAFQITDDLLDIAGSESKTGKTLGSDVSKNKPTLAVIHLLRMIGESEKDAVMKKLSAGGISKEAVMEMLRSYGSLEYTYKLAQEFVRKAITALGGLKKSDAKDALIETARSVADRVI